MRKLAAFVLDLSIWKPGTALMRRLRFPAKMVLVSAAFMMPLIWLLGAYFNSKCQDIAFVQQELNGVRYARIVYPALDAAGVWRYQVHNAALGESDAQVIESRQRFETTFKKLEEIDNELGQSLTTTASLNDVRSALHAAQAAQGTPDEVFGTLTGVSRTLMTLLDQVTEKSGLALDPELPSYYLMSAVMMRGSEVIRSTAELRGLGYGAIKLEQLTPETAARIQERLAVIDYETGLAKSDFNKVKVSTPEVANVIANSALETTEKFAALVRHTFLPGQTEVKGDRAAYLESANQTLQSQFAEVRTNLGVLENMLAVRKNVLIRDVGLTLLITFSGLLLALYLFTGFYRSMMGGFKSLRRHLINISMGDLRADIRRDGTDEIAALLREVGNMQHSLSETVKQVQESSDAVVNSSEEIARGTQDLSGRTEAAAAALEQTSASLEQTTSSVQMTADSVKQASEIAVENAKAASHGGMVMQDVVQTMEKIHDSSKKISDIIGVIDGIAFQTNILALNAAVEAARAGEQGRGFAVVATEVRALAGRSAEAAKEIKSLIISSTDQIKSGTGIVLKAGDAMKEIVHNADKIKRLLDEVADGAREQSLGINQIGSAVQDLDQNTQANAALVQETAEAAASQRDTAVRMAAHVDEFRLPGAIRVATRVEGIDVDSIIDAHRQWKLKLREAIENGEIVDTKTLTRDNCCSLGKWIYGDGQRLRERTLFQDLIVKHAHFHQVAGQVGELINSRQYIQAEDALASGTPFSKATSEVVLVLSTAKRLGFQ